MASVFLDLGFDSARGNCSLSDLSVNLSMSSLFAGCEIQFVMR